MIQNIIIPIVGLILIFFVAPRLKIIKNLWGFLRGYGCCPNCGDSLSWKSVGSIQYEPTRGVIICFDCLFKKKELDKNRILKDLTKIGWPQENIDLVEKALEKRKSNLESCNC